MKPVLVVPVHIDPSIRWLNAINNLACDIIIVDDSNGIINRKRFGKGVVFYDYKEQEKELGENYKGFEVFQGSSACRNFGNWIAMKKGYDCILSIDSDCIPNNRFVYEHIKQLGKKGGLFTNSIGNGWYPRGYPYWARNKEIVCNMGLWSGELDINGQDKIKVNPPKEINIHENKEYIFGAFSGMNWAAKAEWIPCLMFLPNWDYEDKDGKIHHFRRHDDIWGGYIFQKFLQKAEKVMTYGFPIVWHYTIVDPQRDAEEEAAMNYYDKLFKEIIDDAFEKIKAGTPIEMLKQFNPKLKGTPFEKLEESINWWKKLYNNL